MWNALLFRSIWDHFFLFFFVLVTLLFLKTKKVKLDSLYFLSDGHPGKQPNAQFCTSFSSHKHLDKARTKALVSAVTCHISPVFIHFHSAPKGPDAASGRG